MGSFGGRGLEMCSLRCREMILSWTHVTKSYRHLTYFLFPFRLWWWKVHLVRGTAMAPALLHLLSMLRVAGGCRLLPRARWDPLSQLQQQPIERSTHPHTLLPYTRIRLYFTLLCPHLRTSCLNLSPCWYCCLRSQQTSNTQLSQLHQNTPRIGLLVYDRIKQNF